MVLRSWVSTIRPAAAAHARMSGSGVCIRPTSCTRTRSRPGTRASRLLVSRPSKSSSVRKRSSAAPLPWQLLPARHQLLLQLGVLLLGGRDAGFLQLAPDLGGLLITPFQVSAHVLGM